MNERAPVVTGGDRSVVEGGNWGRWGDADERGALNLLTPETVLSSTRVCSTGRVYNLGLPVHRDGAPVLDYRGAPHRLTLTSQTDSDMYQAFNAPPGLGANEDVLIVPTHNGTHMDALSHVFADGQLYNGFPEETFASHTGAGRCGIEKLGGFVGKAVLLDVARHYGGGQLEPGYPITADDLEACRAAQGNEITAGDILLVHTGWLEYYNSVDRDGAMYSQAGLDLSAAEFIDDHEIAAVGADNSAVEVIPFSEGRFLALHTEMLVKRGVTFLEHLRLTDMVADRCYESLFVAAPLLVTGATGSPLNPIAIG
jgi:kynurenine formamidase